MSERIVHLRKPLKKLPSGRHPWLFSKGIGRVVGGPAQGELVKVFDSEGTFVGTGYYNDRSKITVRILEWDEQTPVDEAWWRGRIERAVRRREVLPGLANANACRLVHAEADGLPGLVADRYNDVIVFQALTAGIERVKGILADALWELLHPAAIYERSDAAARTLEGLGECRGAILGEEPPDRVEIAEDPCRFLVDVKKGQKTGFFLDQRENRRRLAPFLRDREVGDFFSYSGAFSVTALLAGAKTCLLGDSSNAALELASENLSLNGLSPQETVQGDLFGVLRRLNAEGRRFDAVIVDPPKLAPTRAHTPKALRGYKDLNLMAMRLLRPGGLLATFSCSGGVSPETFQQVCLWASMDAGREVRVIQSYSQAQDHPVRLGFPESFYLKGLLCAVE